MKGYPTSYAAMFRQRGDNDVPAGLQFAVGLHTNAATQIVEHQNLLGFGQTEFPRNAGMFDRSKR